MREFCDNLSAHLSIVHIPEYTVAVASDDKLEDDVRFENVSSVTSSPSIPATATVHHKYETLKDENRYNPGLENLH